MARRATVAGVLAAAATLVVGGCTGSDDIRAEWERELDGIGGIASGIDVGCQEEFPGSRHDCGVDLTLTREPSAESLQELLERYVEAAPTVYGEGTGANGFGSIEVSWRRDGERSDGTSVRPDPDVFTYRFDTSPEGRDDDTEARPDGDAIEAYLTLVGDRDVRGGDVVDALDAERDRVEARVPWEGLDSAWEASETWSRQLPDASPLLVASETDGSDEPVRGVRVEVRDGVRPERSWEAARELVAAADDGPLAISYVWATSVGIDLDIDDSRTAADTARVDRLQATADGLAPAGIRILVSTRDLDPG